MSLYSLYRFWLISAAGRGRCVLRHTCPARRDLMSGLCKRKGIPTQYVWNTKALASALKILMEFSWLKQPAQHPVDERMTFNARGDGATVSS